MKDETTRTEGRQITRGTLAAARIILFEQASMETPLFDDLSH